MYVITVASLVLLVFWDRLGGSTTPLQGMMRFGCNWPVSFCNLEESEGSAIFKMSLFAKPATFAKSK